MRGHSSVSRKKRVGEAGLRWRCIDQIPGYSTRRHSNGYVCRAREKVRVDTEKERVRSSSDALDRDEERGGLAGRSIHDDRLE